MYHIFLVLTSAPVLITLIALLFWHSGAGRAAVAAAAAAVIWLVCDLLPVGPSSIAGFAAAIAAGAAVMYYYVKTSAKQRPADLKAFVITALVMLAVLVMRAAWVGDDSFITFRVADNFLHGYGLRWNVEERVQAYTNTLWLFVMTVFYGVIRDIFTSALLANLLFTGLAVYIAWRLASDTAAFAVLICALAGSRAFIDYSTSGLENPMTYFLTAVFFLIYIKGKGGAKDMFLLALAASLGFLNRPDLILIFLPALAARLWEEHSPGVFLAAAAGAVPFLAWEVFSVAYYGFPLPNTFYAKLTGGISRFEMIAQGLRYILNSMLLDPATIAVITAGMLACFIRRGRLTALMCGTTLYLGYVIYTGADYMSGRFLTPALFASALALATVPFDAKSGAWKGAALAALMFALMSPYYSFLRDVTAPAFKNEYDTGISDERMYFFEDTSLKRALKEKSTDLSGRSFGADAMRLKKYANGARTVTKHLAIGMIGFYAGPKAYLIDVASLANAYTARLPAAGRWRPGHIARPEPEGYFESVRDGVNVIKEPEKALLYDRIGLVTKAPLFAPGRWEAIRELNF